MEALLDYDSSGSDDEETKLGSVQTAAIVEKEVERSFKNFDNIYDKNQLLAEKSCALENGGKNIINQGSIVSLTKKEYLQSTQGQPCFAKTNVSSLNKNYSSNDVKAANKTKIETPNNLKRFPSNNANSGLYFTTSNRCNYVCKEKNEIKGTTSGAGPVRKIPEVRATNFNLGVRTKPYISKREREKLKDKIEPGISETQLSGCTSKLDNTEMLGNENLEGGNVKNRPPRKVWLQFQGHMQCVNRVKWNPKKQNLLATASMDQTVAIWDTDRNGACLSRLTYHEGAVKDVKWSACGKQVLSCGYDKCARLVDLETGI